MSSLDLDPPRLLDIAGGILDGVVEDFLAGVGAPSAVTKGTNDFATQVDLDLERRIIGELSDATGLGVHGEEFGGDPIDSGAVWVLDPVDGTYNYSTGLPLSGILLALLVDGEATLGLTWLPLSGERYAAHVDGPLLSNGEPMPALPQAPLAATTVAYGPFDTTAGGRYPGARRADVLSALSSRVGRIRMTGSTGIDMAYTAAGVFGGAIAFGSHAWDNAAGAALVRAAGGIATDLAGRPWTVESSSLVAGEPGIHADLMSIITEVTGDEWRVDAETGVSPGSTTVPEGSVR